ncbi:histidine phosphatase family protein [Pseudarthrobacter sp. NamE5]|uniref:histidine phosphatase family protein n=1 Tax=Pseudarthrobacter sp. NamE5 TaxID=2576839 RepID=UPI00110B7B15|nr:hypothetical protein FDW84_19075 [Pseudarthrobacter sp. NamE5]
MRNLYVVIRTEATHLVENLLGGWYDFALTFRGIRDALRIAMALGERIPCDSGTFLVCSDLLRTRQSYAEPLITGGYESSGNYNSNRFAP